MFLLPCREVAKKYIFGALLSQSQHFIPRHKRKNLIKVYNNEGLYGMYYDVNNEHLGEAEIVDTNDYYGL